ncbi:hypothetical protein ACTFR8_23415 [Bacillus cereus group sp. MYBK15-3]|uniref:hypothetical protein n=1 Tax=unclassified Bacillus cereus group TaxID=2750818 RepID=UPI003F7AB212
MNTIRIECGQGIEARKDMQDMVKVLQDKGYIAQTDKDSGVVKLVKQTKDEPSIKKSFAEIREGVEEEKRKGRWDSDLF